MATLITGTKETCLTIASNYHNTDHYLASSVLVGEIVVTIMIITTLSGILKIFTKK